MRGSLRSCGQRIVTSKLRQAMNVFNDVIDGRGDEELPEIEATPIDDTEG